MMKKIINSLKFGSLLGFACNNIKADYNLTLSHNIEEIGRIAILPLKGNNNTILNDPTKCTNNFLDVVNNNKGDHEVNSFEDIKNKYVPVYYYLNGQKDPKFCNYVIELEEPVIHFEDVNNVEEVVWVKKSDKKNIVTFCSENDIKKDIENSEFLVDKKYIDNLLKSEFKTMSFEEISENFNVKITTSGNGNNNIEIVRNFIFKFSDTVKFKISEKDVPNTKEADAFKIAINKSSYFYIDGEILNIFNTNGTLKKDKAILYTFEYNNKKYYFVSDKKHNQNELFGFLKTKETLKDKDIIFDPNSKIKIEGETGNLVPGEYKIIDKVMPKPKDDKIEYKYKFTGDSTAFKFNPEVEENCASKIKVFEMVNSNEKSNFMEDGTTYNTVKYDFVAINKDTNQKFVNNQELEPGTYELKREEKPKEKEKQEKDIIEESGKDKKKMCGSC